MENKAQDLQEEASQQVANGVPAEKSGQSVAQDRRSRMLKQKRRERRINVLRTVLLMLVALMAGVAVGLLVLPRASVPAPVSGSKTLISLPGRLTVSENELDTPMGTYTHKGTETTVTVREAIEESMSLDAARNADGTYDIPSADAVLAIARNRFLLADAKDRGIEASNEDVVAYAKEVWGTDDLSVIAASYSMTQEQAQKLMKESATIKKLRDTVVATKEPADVKEPPAPEGGREDDPMPEYGAYIMGLIGDEWDEGKNTWAREDGPYYAELKNFTISKDGATYSAAKAAYDVALTQNATTEQQTSTEWTTYVNQILSDVTVQLGTLVA